MVMEIEVRSEQPSLSALDQTLEAIRKTSDDEELATLLLMVAELHSDSQCRCEEKAATYGEGTAEADACFWGLDRSTGKMLETFRYLVGELKKK